jgi:hypothetical protein
VSSKGFLGERAWWAGSHPHGPRELGYSPNAMEHAIWEAMAKL